MQNQTLTVQQKKTIHRRVMNNYAIPCELNNQRLLLDALCIVFWPKHNLLVFSDLHFEKASFLGQFSNPIPQLDTLDTINRMLACIQLYKPDSVVCLGDSLHDGNAINRMPQQYLESINSMVTSVSEWVWILGNHDPQIPRQVLGKRKSYLKIDGVLLVHEPEELDEFDAVGAQIIGHFHPKAQRKLAKHNVRGKCFLKDQTKLLMPAFGSYTGGLDSEDSALASLLENDKQCFLSFNNKLFLL